MVRFPVSPRSGTDRVIGTVPLAILAAVALVLSASACSPNRDAPEMIRSGAMRVLAAERLTAAGEGRVEELVLTQDDAFTTPILEASMASGFDLTMELDKPLRALLVPLSERSQGRKGGIQAVFVWDPATAGASEARVIGAYLALDDYAPGVVALSDRSLFMPEGVSATDLRSAAVERVSVSGGFDGSTWTRSAEVTEAAAIVALLSPVEAATASDGSADDQARGDEIVLTLHYREGALLVVRLIDTPGPSCRLECDALGAPRLVDDRAFDAIRALIEGKQP